MREFFFLSLVFGASLALTGVVRSYGRDIFVDVPNARSSHMRPTPRGGGLAIVVTFMAAALLLGWIGRIPAATLMALLGCVPVAGIGLADDLGSVRARWRLTIQLAAAAWALYWLGGLPPLPLGSGAWDLGWVGDLVGLVGLVWLVNLYNFMDGIDGLAGAQSVCVVVAACLIVASSGFYWDLWALVTLGAATLGFLVWNWPPARIFMGDVGSGFLGFVLGVLALDTAHAGVLSLWSWVILLGVFLVDATVTLLRRMLRGDRWYEAHRSHAYQHAAARWGSHRRVTLAVIAIDLLWLLPLAWFVNKYPAYNIAGAALTLVPLVAAALALRAGLARGQRV